MSSTLHAVSVICFMLIADWQKGSKVLIAAHGNSLRALAKHLDNISDKDIIDLNIPTG